MDAVLLEPIFFFLEIFTNQEPYTSGLEIFLFIKKMHTFE